jgi:Immunoglobulin-like domain of bacterial spore germination/Sporulation and spore germination
MHMRLMKKMLLPVGGMAILLAVLFAIILFVFSTQLVQAPVVPVEDIETPVEDLENIFVAEPVAGDVVGFPLTIIGQARVFEQVFQYRVVDDAGVILAAGHAMTDAPDIGAFGSFVVSIHYDAPTTSMGIVEVFSYSARDGARQDVVTIPVAFSSDVSARDVLVYFLPRDVGLDCAAVVPVSRRVPATLAVAHAAMTELFYGVRPVESETLVSLVPPSASLRSLFLEEGVATVMFAQDSFLGIAGSCAVQGIRAQIEATLMQFSSIHSVVILEEGKSPEETLQP